VWPEYTIFSSGRARTFVKWGQIVYKNKFTVLFGTNIRRKKNVFFFCLIYL
jgi:hypothetical protein